MSLMFEYYIRPLLYRLCFLVRKLIKESIGQELNSARNCISRVCAFTSEIYNSLFCFNQINHEKKAVDSNQSVT